MVGVEIGQGGEILLQDLPAVDLLLGGLQQLQELVLVFQEISRHINLAHMKFGAFLHGNGDIDPLPLDVDFGFTDLGLDIAMVVIKSRDFLQVPFQDVPVQLAGAGDPGDGGKKSPLLGFHHLPEFFGAEGLVALEFNLLDGHFAAFIDMEHQVDFVFPRRHQFIGDLGLVITLFPGMPAGLY